jgi:hypothetical protein
VQAVTINTFTSGNEATYGITVGNINSKTATIIWDRVNIDSFSVSDNRIDVGATASFTVGGIYEFDSTAWSGTYTLNDTASKSTVGRYGYRIASVTDSNYGLTAFQQTASDLYVIFDKLSISWSSNSTYVPVNTQITVTVSITRQYDGSTVANYSYNVNRNGTAFGNPHTTGNFTDSRSTIGVWVYNFTSVTDNTYGITAFTDPSDISVQWAGNLHLKTLEWDKSTILTAATVYINNGTIYSKTVDANGWGNFTGITASSLSIYVKWQNAFVNGSFTYTVSGDDVVNVQCKVWSLTFNAKDHDGSSLLTASPTTLYWTFPNATQIQLETATGTETFKTMNGTAYYRIKFQDAWVTANITLSNLSPSTTTVNQNCEVYSLTVNVKDESSAAVASASLTLKRNGTTVNGLYGLPASPTTDSGGAYTWSQLAAVASGNYTVMALKGSKSGGVYGALTSDVTWGIIVVETTAPSVAPGGVTVIVPSGLQAVVGAWRFSPAFALPLPQTNLLFDVSLQNRYSTPQQMKLLIRVKNNNGTILYESKETLENVPPGSSTYTLSCPVTKVGNYIIYVKITCNGDVIGEPRQTVSVTPFDLYLSTIIIAATVGAIILVSIWLLIKHRGKRKPEY